MNTWTPENNLKIPYADRQRNKAIDVTRWIKKQQGLDYLPWAIAQDLLNEYNDDLDVGYETDENGCPYYIVDGRGVFLKPYLFNRSSGKRTPSFMYPVRDARRKSDPAVTLDTIGNQMQRAYVKCISRETGLGWSLFSRYDESIDDAEDNAAPITNTAKKAYTTAKPATKTASVDTREFVF